MCKSNPTRYCSTKAKAKLSAAKNEFLDSLNEPLNVRKAHFESLVEAQKDYDETISGQQVLIQKIKTAVEPQKSNLVNRQKSAIVRRRDKNKVGIIASGKVCSKCKEHKEHSEFSPHKNNPDGFQTNCRACRAVTSKIYHDRTPELTLNRRKTVIDRRELSRTITSPILKTGCVDCHEYHENAMDFDHVPSKGKKLFNVQAIYTYRFKNNDEMIEKIKQEIAKCEVRCANCHRKVTIKRQANNIRKSYLKNPDKFSGKKKIVYGTLAKSSCVDCKTDDFEVLEFDHVRGSKKIEISRMFQRGSWTEEDVKEEIAKCDIRCSNCHRKKTAERLSDGNVATPQQLAKYQPTENETKCDCGKPKRYGSKLCSACHMKLRADWPDIDKLVKRLEKESFESVARSLGISSNAIRNRLKTHGIDYKSIKRVKAKP